MPFLTTKPGIGEACLDALLALMVAKIGDLNTMLALAPSISLGVSVDSTFFHIGDPDTMPDSATSPFWISVVGGGRADGRDTEVEIKQSGPGYWYTIYHNLYFYLHPQFGPSTDAFAQAATRERLRARVCDWLLYDVFNNGMNYTVTLGSQQMTNGTADTLDECRITDLTKGFVLKSFGTTQYVYMAHMVHRGRVYGGY